MHNNSHFYKKMKKSISCSSEILPARCKPTSSYSDYNSISRSHFNQVPAPLKCSECSSLPFILNIEKASPQTSNILPYSGVVPSSTLLKYISLQEKSLSFTSADEHTQKLTNITSSLQFLNQIKKCETSEERKTSNKSHNNKIQDINVKDEIKIDENCEYSGDQDVVIGESQSYFRLFDELKHQFELQQIHEQKSCHNNTHCKINFNKRNRDILDQSLKKNLQCLSNQNLKISNALDPSLHLSESFNPLYLSSETLFFKQEIDDIPLINEGSDSSIFLSAEALDDHLLEGIIKWQPTPQQQQAFCATLEFEHDGRKTSKIAVDLKEKMIKQWLAADAEWKRSTMGMQNNSRIDVLPSLTFDSNELNPLQPTYIVIHTALNEQELKDGTQLHHHLSSQQKLTSKRRMEIKRQIEQAKQYQKLFDVWIRKEWIENEEEKMMWDKAEEKQERGKIQHEENIDKWAFGELTLEELEKQLADTTEGEAGSGEDLQLLLKQIKIKQKEMERQKQLTELSDWQRVRVIFAKENEKEKKKEERTNRALLEKSEEMNKDNSLRKDADEVIQEPNEEKEIHYEQVSAHSAVQHSNTKIYDFGDLFIGSSLLSPFDRTNSSSHSVSNKPPFELSILHSTPTSNHFAPAVTQRNFISGFRDDCSLQQRKMPHYVHFQSASSLSHDSLNYNFSDPFNVVSYAQSSFYSIDPICINTDLCEIDNFTTESAVLDTDEYLKRFNDPFYNPRLMKKLRHWGKKTNQVARQMEVLISEMENIAPIIFPFCLKRKYQRKR